MLERILGLGGDEDDKKETNLLNERADTKFHVSLSDRELGVSGSLTLKDFRLGALQIKKGSFLGSNRRLKAYLESAISDEIYKVYGELSFELENFEEPETDVNFSLTRKLNKNERWTATLGYHDEKDSGKYDGIYASASLAKRF